MMGRGPLVLAAEWLVCAAAGTAAVHRLAGPNWLPLAVGLIALAAASAAGLLVGQDPWRGRAHVAAVVVLASWLFAAVAVMELVPLLPAAPVVVGAAALVALHTAHRGAQRQLQDHSTEHVLYRFYDVYERLLYVGRTSQPPRRRFGQHRANKDWWGDVAVRELTHYPTAEALEAAERQAIRKEKPKHNKVRYAADGAGYFL